MPIYLDHAASAPMDPAVREAMLAWAGRPGNASATHAFGREARQAVDVARRQVAALLKCSPDEIVFTSGATEANVTAVRSAMEHGRRAAAKSGKTGRVLVSVLEHASVAATVDVLAEEFGLAVGRLPVAADGRVRPEELLAALTPETVLVAVMWVNNVLGSVQPVAEIGRAVAAERARRGAGGLPLVFHCDAVQAAPCLSLDAAASQADTLSVSAHKIGGPQGVGALYVRRGQPLAPLLTGGGQEAGRRSGTENVAGLVGFGEAARLAAERLTESVRLMEAVRQRLLAGCAGFDGRLKPVSPEENRAPGIVYLASRRLAGDLLALKLDAAGIAVSSGSACEAGQRKSSSVLAAVLGEAEARHAGIRVSFGRTTTDGEIDALLAALRDCGA